MSHYAMQAYATTAVTTTVDCASPHQLVLMLYDGVLKHIRLAEAHMQQGDIGKKSAAIHKSITLITQGLRANLDLEKGGDIATKLDDLYDYSERLLTKGNATNETQHLRDVIKLFEELRAGWAEITPQSTPAPRMTGGGY